MQQEQDGKMPQETAFSLALFVYEKIHHLLDDTFEEWWEQIKDWEFHPIYNSKNDLVAVATVTGNQVHLVVDQTYKGRWLSKRAISMLEGLLSRCGEVVTCADNDNDEARKFLVRLGFEAGEPNQETGLTDYVLKKLNLVTSIDKFDCELVQLEGDLVEKLFVIEEEMKKLPQVDIPKTHYFANGLYAREINIKKGTLLIGKMHKFSQINTVSKGDISVLTENGWKRMKAPFTFESPAGIKRAGYAHEDTTWTTYCGTKETEVDKMDEVLTIGTYQDYLKIKETLLIERK